LRREGNLYLEISQHNKGGSIYISTVAGNIILPPPGEWERKKGTLSIGGEERKGHSEELHPLRRCEVKKEKTPELSLDGRENVLLRSQRIGTTKGERLETRPLLRSLGK